MGAHSAMNTNQPRCSMRKHTKKVFLSEPSCLTLRFHQDEQVTCVYKECTCVDVYSHSKAHAVCCLLCVEVQAALHRHNCGAMNTTATTTATTTAACIRIHNRLEQVSTPRHTLSTPHARPRIVHPRHSRQGRHQTHVPTTHPLALGP